MEFKAITTQEEFDTAVKERLKRQEESIKAEFSNYEELKNENDKLAKKISSLTEELNANNTKYSDLEKKLNESNDKVAKYESDSVKTRIALEAGLPFGMVERVKGGTEDEIRVDVDSLLSFASNKTTTQPMFQTSEGVKDLKNELYKKMANSLNKE